MIPFDPLAPTEDLISFALSHPPTDEDDDPRREAVRALWRRCTREVFDAAAGLLASMCPVERTLGAMIHGQLGYPDQLFSEESARLLSRLLEVEEDEGVIYSALIDLSFLHEPECVPVVVRFASHPDPDIRYAVTFALCGQDDDRAIAALIALTTDVSAKVREWATFTLGTQSERDAPDLRAALWARTADLDSFVRGEALKGLAQRKVECTADAIIAELDGPDSCEYAVEAAEILADPRLVPALERLRDRCGGDEGIERTIETLRGSE